MSAIRNEEQINSYIGNEDYAKAFERVQRNERRKLKKLNGNLKANKSTGENHGKSRKHK